MHELEKAKQEIQPDPIYVHTPIAGTTDFAQDQYTPKHAIEQPGGDKYPERTDTSGDTDFYGKRMQQ